MTNLPLEGVVRNVDVRLSKVEQILPTLATREELHAAIQAAIAPLATREELRAAIAPLATKEELRAAIAPLATRDEMHAAIRSESERTRALIEDLRDDNRIILEHLVALSARVDVLARR
jgi:alkylhydroperoxidase/carboxymuconolactone decarboxylase family protein YurZ